MRSKAERAMFASLVQGSAAELTRFSIVSIWKAQNRGELPCSSTSTVHDEVQVDCSIHDAKDVAIKVQELMESFTGLFGTIPVVADLEITKTSWANKEEYKP
jgi:DNA polymerase I-like protein with 3'-5' exonuclease and polymerase domains